MENENPEIVELDSNDNIVDHDFSSHAFFKEESDDVVVLDKSIVYDFAVWLKKNGYSMNTLRNYHTVVLRACGTHYRISPKRLKAFLSVKSTLVKRSAIKKFIEYLEDVHSIVIPSFRFPRTRSSSKALEVLSRDEVNRILDVIRPDLKMFFKVMFFGGLRISEVAYIKVEDFDWHKWVDNPVLHGDLIIRKTKRNKERIVPLHPDLMREIFLFAKKHPDGALMKGLLFNFRYDLYVRRKKRKGFPIDVIDNRYVFKVYRFALRGLQEASFKAFGRRVKSHSIRASRATFLDSSGVPPTDIRDFLGHDSLATTNRYIRGNPDRLRSSLGKINEEV